jgi:hypothetical protein
MSDAEQTGPEAPAWPVVVDEAFAKSPDGWSFAATTKTPPLRFDAPGMVVTLPGGDTSVAAFWYEARQFTDVAVTVTLVVLAAQEPTQSYCGVSFRAPVGQGTTTASSSTATASTGSPAASTTCRRPSSIGRATRPSRPAWARPTW